MTTTSPARAAAQAVPPACRVDGGTTVFLDRDGVINRRVRGGYVRSWPEFDPLPGAVEAVATLTRRARRVVVVTNQRCVALGLVPRRAVDDIHARLESAVRDAGGRLDGVLVCPHGADEGCSCRKPLPGLLLRAVRRWPDIDLRSAVLVGDSESDLRCAVAASPPGRDIGRVWVGEDAAPSGRSAPHASYGSLARFVSALAEPGEVGP